MDLFEERGLSVTTLFLYMAVYLLPAFLLSHLALDVLLRNPRQVEHRLLSLFVFGYAMLFLAEFGRHLSPIEASPAFVTYWFGSFARGERTDVYDRSSGRPHGRRWHGQSEDGRRLNG